MEIASAPPDSEPFTFAEYIAVGSITLLGLILRLHRLGTDLLVDEITTLTFYRNMPWHQVLTVYLNSNNHTLNTLLMKLCVAIWGESEMTLRLPAVTFGTLTIPLLYLASRKTLGRAGAFAAALLLAVSYHHIFFSQNARGYTAYLCFGVASTAFLGRALRRDRTADWIGYSLSTLFGFLALLNTAFIFMAHGMICAAAVLRLRLKGTDPRPLFKRLLQVIGIVGLLGFNLYANIIPQVYAFTTQVYREKATGYSPFSMEFAREVMRGLSAGFGGGWLLGAVPFLLIACFGFIALMKRDPILTLGLLLPNVLMALFLLARGLTFSPRFFLLGLPLACITAAECIRLTAHFGSRFLRGSPRLELRLVAGLSLLLASVSLVSLRSYYRNPKQNYRESLAYAAQLREPGAPIMAIYLTQWGINYYAPKMGLVEGKDYYVVRSLEALDTVLNTRPGSKPVLLTTFPRALRVDFPDLDARVQRDWEVAREFPGTVGDGTVSVWRMRDSK
ncbi:glycosyltransferase family 39 protein [Candidatus Sumerlaeota bacterium]|nr:glycosyltransferase family 39 protein [Candidatus Sumerlaeota bacterium]